MRVDCENCGAQYKIPTHKLVKDVNKATCRKCGHRMLIKKSTEGPVLATSPSPPPAPGKDERTLITSQPAAPASPAGFSDAQARAVAAFPAPPEINEWEDDQPTKIRSEVSAASDNRPTAPGSDIPSSLAPGSDGEPTQILDEATAPEPIPTPRPQRAPAPQVSQQTRPRRGYDPSGDLTWAIVGTLAAIVGVLLLAANLSGSNIQRFGGLLLSLGGTSATLFILVTGGRGSKKASLLIATILSVLLSFGGATAINLLHVGYASWSTNEVAATIPVTPPPTTPAVAAEPVEQPAEPVEEPTEEPSAEDLLASAELTPPDPEPIADSDPEPVKPSTPASTPSSTPASTPSSTPASTPSSTPASTPSSRPSEPEDDIDSLFTADNDPEPAASSRSADSVLLPTVVDTILRNNKGVKRCFQYEYKRAGSVPRSLPVGFKGRSSGSVSSAWVSDDSYKGTELESCLKGAIMDVQFPPFDGDPKTMSYTFRL